MIGQTISHYQVLAKLGEGGMGVVYKARDLRLDRLVALKFLPPDLVSDPLRRQRFVHEAKAASALNHPHIITVYDIGEVNGRQFVAMELLEGQNLKERIGNGPLPVGEILELGVQVTDALKAAHGKGILHRDIKPANIFVTPNGGAKLLDFGVAKLTSLETDEELADRATVPAKEETEEGTTDVTRTAAIALTAAGATVGTLGYMSPEQVRAERVDGRTDLFSLGAVLYEMATGRQAFAGRTMASIVEQVLHGQPAPVSKSNPDVPSGLASVIGKALEKTREARYPSADEMLEDLRRCQETLKAAAKGALAKTLVVRLRNPWVSGALALSLAVAGLVSYLIVDRRAKIDWARRAALPEIERLIDETRLQEVASAYDLAVRAEKHIPREPKLVELLAKCSMKISVTTDPPGARVSVKEYSSPDEAWRVLGTTPLDEVRLPRGFLRWKIEKDGYETVYAAAPTFTWQTLGFKPLPFHRKLDRRGTIPEAVTRVRGSDSRAGRLPDFLMDVHEVTNREYKAFIVAGGYARREFWKNAFVTGGRTLSWEEALALFVDASGRPGPSTWEAGDYPEGKDVEPVSGVSWYEAAAYAEFAGKALPTIDHWGIAAFPPDSIGVVYLPSILLSWSNFGKGLARVGSTKGIGFFGCYDMLGNVREWCSNQYGDGRATRGCGWNDAGYNYASVVKVSPFDRDPRNGFRCVRYLAEDEIPGGAFDPVAEAPAARDFLRETPASDEVFQVLLDGLSYDKAALDARTERIDDTPPNWVLEKVSVAAAYDGERLPIFLYVPRNARPPFQAVVFYPGSDAFAQKQEELTSFELDKMDFVVKSGRVVVVPVYKGAMERADAYSIWFRNQGTDDEFASHRWSENLIKIVKDFRRTLDYLETRRDIDSSRIGFQGFSEGGIWAPVVLATEGSRIRVSAIHLGGLYNAKFQPQSDPLNYVTRVRVPTLMLHGMYDPHLTLKEEAEPMFRLLGTPEEHKKLITYPTDHFLPKTEMIKETLAWYDKYLGPVQ